MNKRFKIHEDMGKQGLMHCWLDVNWYTFEEKLIMSIKMKDTVTWIEHLLKSVLDSQVEHLEWGDGGVLPHRGV